jgi:predicted ArsR family transcriptional regulator
MPDRAEAMAALADPLRRDLYRLATDRAIGRDDVAATLGIPRSTAAFHLDRLAEAGLLSVSYERRSGRTGPGAGRPAKLYRATAAEVAASIPERHYELVGELLAAAAEAADGQGLPFREALGAEAFATGVAIGSGCGDLDGSLTACGFAPRARSADSGQEATTGDIVLENCPFHALAARHTELICSANLDLVRGLVAGAGDERTAVLAPADGRCCVEIRAGAR